MQIRRTRQLPSSRPRWKFILIETAILFLIITYHSVLWKVVVSLQASISSKQYNRPSRSNSAIEESLSSFRLPRKQQVEASNTADGILDAAPNATSPPRIPFRRPSRTLMGIFSHADGWTLRNLHRKLIYMWNDTRLCSWEQITPECQLIYCFVIGAGDPDKAPTQLVSETFQDKEWPLLVEKPILTYKRHQDLNYDDTVLLNIRENMNEGKSETFFYFASLLMKERGDIDYAMKIDSDAALLFHAFLRFSQTELPPAPMNRRIMAGILRNKYHWNTTLEDPADVQRKEEYWIQEYDRVHLYLAGQCYLMSRDLVEWVVEEAPRSSTYIEGHEDHDVTAMILKSPKPVTLVIPRKTFQFWEHPVKKRRRWQGILKREEARMKGQIFKGQKLELA